MSVSTSGNNITKNVAVGAENGSAIYIASGASLSLSGDVVQSNTTISGSGELQQCTGIHKDIVKSVIIQSGIKSIAYARFCHFNW